MRSIILTSLLAFLCLAAVPGQARADAVTAFTAGFDKTSDKVKPFPAKLELFDFADKQSALTFGKGQPWRLVNFWAVWCPPCIMELPSLKALQDKTKGSKDFQVVLVSDDMPPSGKTLKYVMKKNNLPDADSYYVKDFEVSDRFGIEGLPTTFLVSPEGKIVYTFVGDGKWDSPEAAAFFQKIAHLPGKP
jgi:thiol-disulfide isomerase/thioredoxin